MKSRVNVAQARGDHVQPAAIADLMRDLDQKTVSSSAAPQAQRELRASRCVETAVAEPRVRPAVVRDHERLWCSLRKALPERT